MQDVTIEREWRAKGRKWGLNERQPTTICYADLCGYAYGCPSRKVRPAKIPMARCGRYRPDHLRPKHRLSAYLQNQLASSYSVSEPGLGTRLP